MSWEQVVGVWSNLVPNDETPRSFEGESLTPKQAGKVFEFWLRWAFHWSPDRERFNGLVYPSYYVEMERTATVREEIDGLVVCGWLPFLLQAKLTTEKTNFEPIAVLDARVRERLDVHSGWSSPMPGSPTRRRNRRCSSGRCGCCS